MANTLKLHRNGAVGFIDWLDATKNSDCIPEETNRKTECKYSEQGLRNVKWPTIQTVQTVFPKHRVLGMRCHKSGDSIPCVV